jgi:Short C-terminal domain
MSSTAMRERICQRKEKTMQPMGGFGGPGGPMMGGMGMGLGGGLLGTLLAGGLGYFVGRRSGQGNGQNAASPQQYRQQAASDPSSQRMSQLKQLGQLRESGIVTEEEFQQEKQRILTGT